MANLVGGSSGWEATSVSSNTPHNGDNSFTLVESGKVLVGQFVTVADVTLFLQNNYFVGIVKPSDSVTGAITVTLFVIGGTTATNWAITASAKPKGRGLISPVQVLWH